MNFLTILIIFLVVVFVGYPLIRKGKKEVQPDLGNLEEEIEREVRVLRKSADLICPACGTKCVPGDRFCIRCGAKLKTKN